MSTAENEDNVPGKTSDGFAIPRPLIRMEETTRTSDGSIDPADAEHQDVPSLTLEYEPPRWSDVPENSVKFEVIKEGCIIETTDDMKKPYIVLGRHPTNDWILYHESISRKHAVLQFRKDGVAYLYDLGSTHGSFINKKRIIPRVHSVVYPGDILKFGSSSRMYVMIAKEINPLYVEDTLVKNLQAAADGQARRGLDISGEISEKTAASMLLEIRDLCSSLDQEFNVEVGSIPHDNNGPLYYGHAEIHVGSLTEEAETVEAEGVSPSRKEAHRKVIIGIYTKLRDAGAFSALKARNTQQENFNAALKLHYESDESDDFYDRSLPKRKRIADYSSKASSVSIERLAEDKARIGKLIEEERANINSAQKVIESASTPTEDEVEGVLNTERVKEAKALIRSSNEEVLALEKELEEVERLIKVVSPSSLLQSLASSKSNEENIQSNIPKRSVAGVKKKLLDKRSRLTNASMRGKDPDIHEEKKTVPVPASGAVDLKCASFQSQGSVKERIGQKLKLGLNVPASRMKGLGHNAGAPSEETESGRAKVNGPTKPASELPENLGSSTWDILEMEDCVDCVDQQTNRGISESEIRRLNAEYEY